MKLSEVTNNVVNFPSSDELKQRDYEKRKSNYEIRRMLETPNRMLQFRWQIKNSLGKVNPNKLYTHQPEILDLDGPNDPEDWEDEEFYYIQKVFKEYNPTKKSPHYKIISLEQAIEFQRKQLSKIEQKYLKRIDLNTIKIITEFYSQASEYIALYEKSITIIVNGVSWPNSNGIIVFFWENDVDSNEISDPVTDKDDEEFGLQDPDLDPDE
jgi:hypothetical protein